MYSRDNFIKVLQGFADYVSEVFSRNQNPLLSSLLGRRREGTERHDKALVSVHDLVSLLADGASPTAGVLQAVHQTAALQVILLAHLLAFLCGWR